MPKGGRRRFEPPRHACILGACYDALPANIQALADKSFELVNENPRHPSVHLKKVGRYWSARVGLQHRALAIEGRDALVWFWVGPHREYERIVG